MINQAVIACGGKGSRMGNDFGFTQKCLLPIAGKPILKYLIKGYAKAGIKEIFLLTNHHSKDIECFIQHICVPNVEVFAVKSKAKGTAMALKSIEDKITGPFSYSHGNIIYSHKWISKINEIYEKQKPIGVFGVSELDLITSHPHILGAKGRRVKKIFYPNGELIPPNSLCALELSTFSTDYFDLLKEAKSGDRLCEPLTEASVLDNNSFLYYKFPGMWIHIEVPNDLKRANTQIKLVLSK